MGHFAKLCSKAKKSAGAPSSYKAVDSVRFAQVSGSQRAPRIKVGIMDDGRRPVQEQANPDSGAKKC